MVPQLTEDKFFALLLWGPLILITAPLWIPSLIVLKIFQKMIAWFE